MRPSIAVFPVTRWISSVSLYGSMEYVPTGAPGSLEAQPEIEGCEADQYRTVAELAALPQSDLCKPALRVALAHTGITPNDVVQKHYHYTCALSCLVQSLRNRHFSPVSFPVPEAYKVGSVIIPANFDMNFLTHKESKHLQETLHSHIKAELPSEIISLFSLLLLNPCDT